MIAASISGKSYGRGCNLRRHTMCLTRIIHKLGSNRRNDRHIGCLRSSFLIHRDLFGDSNATGEGRKTISYSHRARVNYRGQSITSWSIEYC